MNYRCLLFTCLLLGFSSSFIKAGDYEPAVYTDAAGKTLSYQLHKPKDYDAAKKYPLVVFLHGSGERGSDNAQQLKHGGPVFVTKEAQKKYPAFVVFPQCPKESSWAKLSFTDKEKKVQMAEQPTEPARLVMELIAKMEKENSIDPNRIYLGGLSMGGYGTWDLLARYPNRFAAAVPICGGGDPTKAASFKEVPIRVFHAVDDPAVPVERSREMVKALKDAGGSPKYSEYDHGGHASWDIAFAEPDFLSWLFEQKRK